MKRGAEVDFGVVGHTEEQNQCLGGDDEEDTSADYHHNLLHKLPNLYN